MKPSGKWQSAACFVALFVAAGLGLAGAGWAALSGSGEQAFDEQPFDEQPREKGAEAAESEPRQQKDSADAETGEGLVKWAEELLQHCDGRCSASPNNQTDPNKSGLSFFAYPGCLVSKLLDVCNFQGSGAEIGIAIFVIIFAVLTRQAIIGYLQALRLSFALFLLVFFAAVGGYFKIHDISEIAELDSPIFGFAVVVFASLFLAGVLSFWTKYLLDLLAVVLLAVLFVGLMALASLDSPDEAIYPPLLRDLLGVVTGMAGGVWLYWWREIRSNRKKQQQTDGPSSGPGPGSGPNAGPSPGTSPNPGISASTGAASGKAKPSASSGAASGKAKPGTAKGASTQALRLQLRRLWRWRRSSSN